MSNHITKRIFSQLDRRGTVKDLANLFNGLAEKEEQVRYNPLNFRFFRFPILPSAFNNTVFTN